jgi:hypothetical protein
VSTISGNNMEKIICEKISICTMFTICKVARILAIYMLIFQDGLSTAVQIFSYSS